MSPPEKRPADKRSRPGWPPAPDDEVTFDEVTFDGVTQTELEGQDRPAPAENYPREGDAQVGCWLAAAVLALLALAALGWAIAAGGIY